MSDQTIPPCPVCGKVPIMSIYQSENRIDGCKCIQWPIPCTQEYWGLWCDEAIGRHTRANLGITTIAQLNDRLAPDPRVAVLDILYLYVSEWRNGNILDEALRDTFDAVKHRLIAARRGEVAND